MRVVGLLSWFDESPSMLAASVAGMGEAGVDHLVAVDGPYKLYDHDGLPCSSREQHDTIISVAQQFGMGVTIHVPARAWENNEIEKRTALFAFGAAVATPYEDWFLVVDADEVIVHANGYRAELEQSKLDVCQVTHVGPDRGPTPEGRFFRAHPRGIRVEKAHWHYKNGDGDVLWGPGQVLRDRTSIGDGASLLGAHSAAQPQPQRLLPDTAAGQGRG
jgi:hypothetical protein